MLKTTTDTYYSTRELTAIYTDSGRQVYLTWCYWLRIWRDVRKLEPGVDFQRKVVMTGAGHSRPYPMRIYRELSVARLLWNEHTCFTDKILMDHRERVKRLLGIPPRPAPAF